MATAPHPSTNAATDEPQAAFGDLRVLLACPECGASGWIEWKHLNRGLKCAKCQCLFGLGRNGKLHAQSTTSGTRFACPRCGQAGTIPSAIAIREAECGSCKLPLVRGPDQKLHSVEEAAQLRRAANLAARQPTAKTPAWALWFQTPSGQPHKPRLALAAILLLAGLWGAVCAWNALFPHTPEAVAADFTYTCLSGSWNDAEEFLQDDLLQISEFNRWRMRHFTSILDKYRPAGDSVDVLVETLESTPDTRTFRVTLNSPHLGTRSHEQRWRQHEEAWYFDAHATISAE